mmetsp:Transcript_33648/g.79420  ORF Transcript_33648/g.79420 Transcript_33648/m.79420 type:complete len:140 (-) Transcript_33648:17-436(-)
MFCSMATVCFTIGKLFWWNAGYRDMCETRQCSRLVHNATMTLACLFFDAFSVIYITSIEAEQAAEKQTGSGLKVVRHFFKFYTVVTAMIWLVYEVQEAAWAAPGVGSIALASTAIVAQALLAIFFILAFVYIYREDSDE